MDLASNKPRLLAIIATSIVAILVAPIIAPHFADPSMFYHILLHTGSLIIAVFISVISILSYRRTHKARIFLTSLSFLSLSVVESLNLFSSAYYDQLLTIPYANIDLSHIFLLIMLTLFGAGVLRVEK